MNHSTQQLTTVNYLIIGQGLAGTLLAHELSNQEKSFVIIDEKKEFNSSKVAAGMFNPISGKRMVIGWKTAQLLDASQKTYTELENILQTPLYHQQNTYTIFGSIKEQNDLSVRMEDTAFAQYVNIDVEEEKNLKQPFSAFEIKGSGWVNLPKLIDGFVQILIDKKAIIQEYFNYSSLFLENNKWHYKNIVADKVVFCEGYKNKDNPYFNWLPFVLCKGDVLIIRCNITEKKIVKKGIFLVSIGNGLFKVGATYEWTDLTENPTEKGRLFLIEKLNELLRVLCKHLF
ncbi:MAG: FAD-dependent oxidoreductase [Bacteroidetes bacterium]|nr:FAD-dependent oxidoreductase [Bacteroidota bacterium]